MNKDGDEIEILATEFSVYLLALGASPWNTATYSSGDDGYTVKYDGKSYTVALSDKI